MRFEFFCAKTAQHTAPRHEARFALQTVIFSVPWERILFVRLRSPVQVRHEIQVDHGLMTGTERSSKCGVFRVARVARQASTIPAIIVSRGWTAGLFSSTT